MNRTTATIELTPAQVNDVLAALAARQEQIGALAQSIHASAQAQLAPPSAQPTEEPV